MSKFVVVQHGTNVCRKMIAAAFPRTWEWCQNHALHYHGCTRRQVPEVHIYWEKIALLRSVLDMIDNGDEGVFLDADTCIINTDVSPRGVLPEGIDIGMRKVDERLVADGWYPQYFWPFWQAGVIFFRKSPAFTKIIDEVWALRFGPFKHRYAIDCQDEWALNEVLNGKDEMVQELDAKWNCFGGKATVTHDAVIRAFHGWEHDSIVRYIRQHALTHKRRMKWSA